MSDSYTSSLLSAFSFTGSGRLSLGNNYVPTDDVVIIGRGKKTFNHKGNVKFRQIIQRHLPIYQQAMCKSMKSDLLWNVLQEVRNMSQEGLGFVKRDPSTKEWIAVDDASARISISQAFRDCLSGKYKSSKAHKLTKHKNKKQMEELTKSDSLLAMIETTFNDDLVQPQRQEPDLFFLDFKCTPTASSNLDVLRTMLDKTSKAIEASSFQSRAATSNPVKEDLSKTFESLFQKFGANACHSVNPFEPTPIAEPISSSIAFGTSFASEMESDSLNDDELTSILSEMSSLADDEDDLERGMDLAFDLDMGLLDYQCITSN